jgi:hypothetical protein
MAVILEYKDPPSNNDATNSIRIESITMLTYQVNLKDASRHLARITLWIPVDGQNLTEVVFPVWTPGSYMLR